MFNLTCIKCNITNTNNMLYVIINHSIAAGINSVTAILSVHDLRVTIVTLQVRKDIVGVFAGEVAEAGLNPQH